jgi:hypothetical protein
VVFVGVEYPYLAILAVIAFTMAVSGLIYFFINTYTEALKTPILSTYAQACYTVDNKTYLEVTIKHERGLIVNLQRIEVYSDNGAVVYTPGGSLADINVTMEGFNGRLGPGQVGYVKMIFPSGYFTPNKTYSGVVLFDAGNTVFTFQVVKCPFITYPYPTTLLNLGLTASTGTILALGLIKTVAMKPDIRLYTRENVFYNDTFDTDPFTTGRIIKVNCTDKWQYLSQSIYISINRGDKIVDECIILVNKSLPSTGTVYIAFNSTSGVMGAWGRVDAILYNNSTNYFYTIGARFQGDSADAVNITLNNRYVLYTSGVTVSAPYYIVAMYVFNIGNLSLWLNNGYYGPVSDKTVVPTHAGLGVLWEKANIMVYLDNLLITLNAPPWFVNVTSVPVGWSIVLRDQSGNIVSSGTSVNGNVTLDLRNYNIYIVKNATLEVYDDRGYLQVSRSFDYVMGGEVYIITGTYTPGVEFNGLAVGVGQFDTVILYNITDLGNLSLVQSISANSVFNGSSSIVIGSGTIYLLNTSGVYTYDYSMSMWRLVTSACRASGLGAGIGVVGDGVIVVPGVGNNSLCIYNMTTGSTTLYLVTDGDVTEYTCLASSGYTVYVSLLGSSGPVIVAYYVSSGVVSKNATYSIRDYRLYGLTHDGSRYLYFIIPYGGDYGGVYRLDTLTGETYPLPILLWPGPVSPGDRLEYYSNNLIYARDEGTDELYLIPLEYVL